MADKIIRVADLMQTSLHMIDGLSSVEHAVRQMKRLGVSSLIIDRRTPDDEYGVVTVRHIAEKVISQNRSTTRTSVYEIMTKPAITVPADMAVKYAIRLMVRFSRTRALVTRDRELIGLVTLRDLVVGSTPVQVPEEA